MHMLTEFLVFVPWKQEGERNYKRRFVKILEPLEQWVDKDSIILTDFTVDKGTLHNMGFNSVYQVSISDAPTPQNKYSNQNVMEYLRRIVPRMFQVCYALLAVRSCGKAWNGWLWTFHIILK